MANMDAPRNWGVSKTGRFGLKAVDQPELCERQLLKIDWRLIGPSP